jgi:hypothetical protein
MRSCKECNSAACNTWQRESGYRERPGYVFYQRAASVQRTAKEKGVVCAARGELRSILAERWDAQGGRCFYTDQPMKFTGYPDPDSMTVDRLVPAKGYCRGNIVLARWIVNRSKQDLEYLDLLAFCRELLAGEQRVLKSLKALAV